MTLEARFATPVSREGLFDFARRSKRPSDGSQPARRPAEDTSSPQNEPFGRGPKIGRGHFIAAGAVAAFATVLLRDKLELN